MRKNVFFLKKAIMARFQDLHFWNRFIILDKLAKMEFLGIFLFYGSSGPMCKESNFNGKNGSKFSHFLTVKADGQPDRKMSVFLCLP